ncbi:MAG: hypothetical protein RQ826_11010 [Xanthomonadales bacterium]|nr:hypothetical protein [Xanthomonadales bacterium]
MSCKLTMSLISESQQGNCGDDWKYDVEAKIFHEGLKGEVAFRVPKHTLDAGAVEEPYGAPEPVTVDIGECNKDVLVRMRLTATEVDLFKNDVGHSQVDVKVPFPGPGSDSVVKDVDISAGVRESPGIMNKNSVFTVRVRFMLSCE